MRDTQAGQLPKRGEFGPFRGVSINPNIPVFLLDTGPISGYAFSTFPGYESFVGQWVAQSAPYVLDVAVRLWAFWEIAWSALGELLPCKENRRRKAPVRAVRTG